MAPVPNTWLPTGNEEKELGEKIHLEREGAKSDPVKKQCITNSCFMAIIFFFFGLFVFAPAKL